MNNIMGLIIAIAASALLYPVYIRWHQASVDQVQAQVIAAQANTMISAAQLFITQNNTTLLAGATSTSPVYVSVDTLRQGGFLPASFTGLAPGGGRWGVYVLAPSPNVLAGIVAIGGAHSRKDQQLAQIAAAIGANGGFYPNGDSGIYPVPNQFYGAYGGWSFPTQGFVNYSNAQIVKGSVVAWVPLVPELISNPNALLKNVVTGPADVTMSAPIVTNQSAAASEMGDCAQWVSQPAADNSLPIGAYTYDVNGNLLHCKTSNRARPTWQYTGVEPADRTITNVTQKQTTITDAKGTRSIADGSLFYDVNNKKLYGYDAQSNGWTQVPFNSNGDLTVPSGYLTLINKGAGNTLIRSTGTPGELAVDAVDSNGNSTGNSGYLGPGYLNLTADPNGGAAVGFECPKNGAMYANSQYFDPLYCDNGMLLPISARGGLWLGASFILTKGQSVESRGCVKSDYTLFPSYLMAAANIGNAISFSSVGNFSYKVTVDTLHAIRNYTVTWDGNATQAMVFEWCQSAS